MEREELLNGDGDYAAFLDRKTQLGGEHGFEPLWMPDSLFDFQCSLTEWNIRKGRSATFSDCGTGKSVMQLTFAENVVRHTNKPVLIATPLAVSEQTVREGEKFGIECKRSKDGRVAAKITITNYESLHHFNANDFAGMICDESGCLKNYDGKRKAMITDFMLKMRYRLLCTATAAPNDYIELGASSEALGELGYMDMLTRFFKAENGTPVRVAGQSSPMSKYVNQIGPRTKYRFKRHGEQDFWRWVASWARALRRPSDLGFDDGAFILPELIERDTVVRSAKPRDGFLFEMPAVGLAEQRDELRHTLKERCEMAAEKVTGSEPAIAWCHLNAEGDLLEKLIPDARQVTGSQSDDEKEEIFRSFINGQLRVLVCKPKIGAWGLNLQHCARIVMFPSHSFEQYYQAVRRCWRFGQTRPVTVDMITTEGQKDVLLNLQRKAKQADEMFSQLVRFMNDAAGIARSNPFTQSAERPIWI